MRCLILLSVAALAGCTENPGRYPSLLSRPIESQSLAEPERPAPVATPNATLDARIAEIAAKLDSAAKAFNAAAQEAEAKIAVAQGLAVGSEPWLDAQTALSSVDATRGPVVRALADLEELAIERGRAGQPPYPALDAAIVAARETSRAQQARIATLEGSIAAP